MATRMRLEFNYPGFDQLRKSDPVRAELRRRANLIAAEAGEGFEVTEHVGPHRARASVRAATWDAKRAEATDKVLTRALDAGRG